MTLSSSSSISSVYNPYAKEMHNDLKNAIDTILSLLTRMDNAPMEDV